MPDYSESVFFFELQRPCDHDTDDNQNELDGNRKSAFLGDGRLDLELVDEQDEQAGERDPDGDVVEVEKVFEDRNITLKNKITFFLFDVDSFR